MGRPSFKNKHDRKIFVLASMCWHAWEVFFHMSKTRRQVANRILDYGNAFFMTKLTKRRGSHEILCIYITIFSWNFVVHISITSKSKPWKVCIRFHVNRLLSIRTTGHHAIGLNQPYLTYFIDWCHFGLIGVMYFMWAIQTHQPNCHRSDE